MNKNKWLVSSMVISGAAFAAVTGSLTPLQLSSTAATPASIDVITTAGATGCPAGFSLQWMALPDYEANGNLFGASGDAGYCAASFSGVPGYNQGGGTRYSLSANESVVLRIGDIILDQGASTNCTSELQCGTTYVFRAFCHAVPKGLKKSPLSAEARFSTKSCIQESVCTLSQGFWKTHSKLGPASKKNLVDGIWDGTYISEYSVDGVYLGNNFYDEVTLVNILNTQGTRGNGLPALAHQLIAVKLDVARGTILPPEISAIVAQADFMIGNLVPGVDSLPSSVTSPLTTALDNFIQENHCP